MIRIVLLATLATLLVAAEDGRPPGLGITVDLGADPLADEAGLVVTAVRGGSNGERLGVQIGDRIIGAGDRPVVAAQDLQAALAAAVVGEVFRLVVLRGAERVTLDGELRAETGVRDLAARAEALERELTALRGGDPATQPRYSLQELLVILRQIERDLPAAAAEFKRVYPEGRFRIGIHIDIESHAPPTHPPAESDE